jgi:HTH-type transcriptional regulator / antitoxin HigA
MAELLVPAEAFLPGEYLREELVERGWTEGEFAEIIGRPVQAVSEILNGKKEITAETAIAFGDALGTSPELWLNLQATYRLHQARVERPGSDAVARRARLRELVPVRELQKRGWLPDTDDLDCLEAAVCDLLGIADPADDPVMRAAARRSNAATDLTPEQRAWIARVKQLGAGRVTRALDRDALSALAGELVRRVRAPQDLDQMVGWLADCGVVLILELPLKNSKIDGVSLLSDDRRPIIGLSTRWDRMDIFVFTLLHEIAHILLGHVEEGAVLVDEDVEDARGSDIETAANDHAGRWIFPRGLAIEEKPTMARVLQIARDEHVHACFVIGRLHHDKVLTGGEFRRSIPKVRPFVRLG